MQFKLGFASTLTLGILFSFVCTICGSLLYLTNFLSAPVLIVLVMGFSFLSWLISPSIQDCIISWIYKARIISFEQFLSENPQAGELIKKICDEHNFKIPTIRKINDLNPTAFCYGSYPGNSRIAYSSGLNHYLNEDEFTAVIAHEMGHIVNKDFIVMTIASTLLQLLYTLYVVLTKSRRNDSKSVLPLIGLASYILYLIGNYLLLYLSRTREYLADRFSASATNNPNALSSALIKIAYGITEQPKTERNLLEGTRAMGFFDYKSSDALSARCKSAVMERNRYRGETETMVVTEIDTDTEAKNSMSIIGIEKIFLFDLYNPWAFISELNSTHPLTAKRIKAMSDMALEMRLKQPYNFESVDIYGRVIDKGRMYRQFFTEVAISYLPYIAAFGALLTMFWYSQSAILIPIFIGLGLIVQNYYRYSVHTGFKKTTIFELMCNPYASPIKGEPCEIDGIIIGRTDAGNKYSSGMTLQDGSSSIINLNYLSIFGPIGNFFFGWLKVESLIPRGATVTGWFRRSVSQIIDLKEMSVNHQRIASYPHIWGYLLGIIVMVLGVFILGQVH